MYFGWVEIENIFSGETGVICLTERKIDRACAAQTKFIHERTDKWVNWQHYWEGARQALLPLRRKNGLSHPEKNMISDTTQGARWKRATEAGWRVIDEFGHHRPDHLLPCPIYSAWCARRELPRPREEKKNTSKVDGKKQRGNKSHGGKNASGEVKDSPNARKQGKQEKKGQGQGQGAQGQEKQEKKGQGQGQEKQEKQKEQEKQEKEQEKQGQKKQGQGKGKQGQTQKKTRGKRGGKKVRARKAKKEKERVSQKDAVKRAIGRPVGGQRDNILFPPDGWRKKISGEYRETFKFADELLKQAIGALSEKKQDAGTETRERELLEALLTGGNPLPWLRYPAEKAARVKILLTPDFSGSCAGWSRASCAWAEGLQSTEEADICLCANANGHLSPEWQFSTANFTPKDYKELGEKFDLVLYIGDHDAIQELQLMAGAGCAVIAISNYACNRGDLWINKKVSIPGKLAFVDGAKTQDPMEWVIALDMGLDFLGLK